MDQMDAMEWMDVVEPYSGAAGAGRLEQPNAPAHFDIPNSPKEGWHLPRKIPRRIAQAPEIQRVTTHIAHEAGMINGKVRTLPRDAFSVIRDPRSVF